MPLFTVLTPTYNHENYLGDCILSVIGQTFQDWEMIILDDGSTDKTPEIAEYWAKKDSRITFIRQPNQGVFRLAETYNKGLKMAQGRYISILEGDDLWETIKLQRQKEVLENNPDVVVAWGRATKIQAETKRNLGIIPDDKISIPTTWTNRPIGDVLNALYIENMIPAVTITFRKSTLDEVGGFIQPSDFPTTDLPTLMELALRGEFFFDEEVLASWRISNKQTTKLFPVMMLNQRWKYCLDHLNKVNPTIQERLSIDEKIINQHFKNRLMIAYALSGRYKLIRREYQSARQDYLHAIFYPSFPNPIWRLRAITGLIFSLFHKDVECLSSAMGKVSYKS